jgi:ribosomal protein S18 acetylase RimI-like enzyme
MIHFKVENMNEAFAKEILNWKYESPYDFYNNDLNQDTLNELLNGSYYAVLTHEEIFGFFCTGESAQVPSGHAVGAYEESMVDMGLGMNPKYTGKGKGTEFCTFIISCIQKKEPDVPIRLTVAIFNKRAILLYKKLGFIEKDVFTTNQNIEFMTMIKK